MTPSSTPRPSLLPLVVRGLSHSVDGKTLLSDVDLELRAPSEPRGSPGSNDSDRPRGSRAPADDRAPAPGPGSCTALMGPNGAGKSLLLRLLNGLMEPGRGEILWNGAPPTAAVRRRQALVFQKPVLLRRSVRANVEFVLKLVPQASRADRAARATDLLALAGLAERSRVPARRLSGGEQQRLALVCALASVPDVLLLDEPTASLDPASTAAIESIVGDAVDAGTCVVLVTHDAGQARRVADSIVFMADGRITEHTPGATFFTAPRSAEARDYLAGRIVGRPGTDPGRRLPDASAGRSVDAGETAPESVRRTRHRSFPPPTTRDGVQTSCFRTPPP